MRVKITGTNAPGNLRLPGPWEGREYDVPPGAVLVEYIGDQSPFDDATLSIRIAMGLYTPDEVEIIREMGRRAVKNWINVQRIIRKGGGAGEIKRFQRTYVFGTGKANKKLAEPGEPKSLFQLMTNHDADLLKSSESGHQFRIHPHEPPRLITPPLDLVVVKKDDFRNYSRFQRAMGWGR